LAAVLNAELLNGNLKDGIPRLVIVTPAPRASVTVMRLGEVLYVVGGHWIRLGEPNADYLMLIRREIAAIKNGSLQ